MELQVLRCIPGEGVEKKEMMETITHQAMTITVYERVISKHSVMISDYEKSLKELHAKLSDKEKTVQELAHINFRQCAALAAFRRDQNEKEKELQKKEREVQKLLAKSNPNETLISSLKEIIKETRNILLMAIERSKKE